MITKSKTKSDQTNSAEKQKSYSGDKFLISWIIAPTMVKGEERQVRLQPRFYLSALREILGRSIRR